ncbi:MAG TPA: Stk1 family PASTA domain-containing Ser/Thr kinase, partial [Rubrobacteraceae bacterium]|nr:Stk1 family PASTA domain-containing Ser/Thr kinase [Rubrobacteraceae bacterium]
MAHVYLAHDEVLGRDVALKLLQARYAENEELVERFRREARSAASLSHPHIVPVFDWGETGDGTYYIAMEYLPGGTLKECITSRGTLPPRTVVEVALQIADALEAAHERGVIHRDIKPRNILITDSGHIKVTDFGIARAAEATTVSDLGDILGSVKYMSPEQAAGERVGAASDLYSLGVVLYEMLTGRVPFEVETPWDVAVEHAGGPPPHPRELTPEVPEGLDALVMRLLATHPEDRYGSAAQLIKDLGRVRDGLSPLVSLGEDATTAALGTPAGATLPAPAPGATEPHTRRRRKWFLILAASVALLALLGSVGGAVGWNPLGGPGTPSIPEILRGAPGGASEEAGKKLSRPEEVKVPGVEGSTEQEARERLAEAGFDTEVRDRTSPEEDAGRVLEQSVPGGNEAEEGSRILLTVGSKAPEVAKVPDLVGLSYPEAENKLDEADLLLGGVEEATSETVPAGEIMKQDPRSGTTLDPNSYVYLTTSVGLPDTASAGEEQGSGATGSQHTPSGVTGNQHDPSGEDPSEEAAVAIAVQGHYEAIGAGNFEEAYSYFGPTFRSQHDQASWIAGEKSYEIQSSTIHSLQVGEVLGTTATATVDVSFVDSTGTPRFVIVWSLLKEGGAWKLDEQISAQRETQSQSGSSPAPTTVIPTASPSASPTPSGAGVPPV